MSFKPGTIKVKNFAIQLFINTNYKYVFDQSITIFKSKMIPEILLS